jgi:hypothetical protein
MVPGEGAAPQQNADHTAVRRPRPRTAARCRSNLPAMNKAWRAAGRWVGMAMVLCFFLPFFGISCAGQELVSISGTDLVWGGKPGGLLAEADSMSNGISRSGLEDDTEKEKDKEKGKKAPIQPLAIAALACALIVASLAWVRNKRGAVMGAAIAGGIGFVAMIGLYVTFGEKLKKDANEGLMAEQGPPPSASDDPMEAGMEDMGREMGNSLKKELPELDVGARWGFWLVSLMFITLTVFAGFGLKDPGPTAQAGGPPMAYQMPPQGYGPPGGMPPPR